MVLSLRDESKKLDPTMAAWDKFIERFSEAMNKFADQFVESMKQPRAKYDPEHHQNQAIQQEDTPIILVNTPILDSGSPIDDTKVAKPIHDKVQQKGNLFVHKAEDHEVLLATREDPSSPIHPVCIQLIDDKVSSLPHNDFPSLSLSLNTAIGTFCENKKEFVVANKVFDKSPERNGYTVELEPKPPDEYKPLGDRTMHRFKSSSVPKTKEVIVDVTEVTLCTNKIEIVDACNVFDKIPERRGYITALNPDPPDYDQRTTGGTIEQLDPTHLCLQRVEILKSGNAHEIREAHNEFDEMLGREALVWNVRICHNLYENCFCVVMNNLNKPMFSDSGGKTRDMHTTDLSADDVGRNLPIAEISNINKHLASTDDIVDLVVELRSYVLQVEQIHLEDKVKFEEGNVWIILDWAKDKSLLEAKVVHDSINHYWIWGNVSRPNLYEPFVNGKTLDESLEQEWDSWDAIIHGFDIYDHVKVVFGFLVVFVLMFCYNYTCPRNALSTFDMVENIVQIFKAGDCEMVSLIVDSCNRCENLQQDLFVHEALQCKNNPFLSLRFFYWVKCIYGQWLFSIFLNMQPWKSVRRGWNVFVYEVNCLVLLQAVLAIMEFFFPAFVKTKGAEEQNLDHWDYYVTRGIKSALEQNQSQFVCEDGEDDSSYVNIILVVNVSFDFSTNTFKGFTIVPMQVPNVCLASGIQIIEEFHSLMMSPFFYTGTIMISTRTTNINDLVDMYGPTKNVWVTRDDVTVQQIKITHGNGKESIYREVTKREPSMKRNDNIWTSELKKSGLYWGVIFDPGGTILLPIAEECISTLKCHLEDKVVVNRGIIMLQKPNYQFKNGFSCKICDPPVSVYKGYSMPKDTVEYLLSSGLKNALYSIRAADLTEELFGNLLPCPFQEAPV